MVLMAIRVMTTRGSIVPRKLTLLERSKKIKRSSQSPHIVEHASAMGSEGAGAPPAPLRPEECLDLDLWDHIFDDAAVAKRSPLRTLARDMRAQLEVPPRSVRPELIRRHLP